MAATADPQAGAGAAGTTPASTTRSAAGASTATAAPGPAHAPKRSAAIAAAAAIKESGGGTVPPALAKRSHSAAFGAGAGTAPAAPPALRGRGATAATSTASPPPTTPRGKAAKGVAATAGPAIKAGSRRGTSETEEPVVGGARSSAARSSPSASPAPTASRDAATAAAPPLTTMATTTTTTTTTTANHTPSPPAPEPVPSAAAVGRVEEGSGLAAAAPVHPVKAEAASPSSPPPLTSIPTDPAGLDYPDAHLHPALAPPPSPGGGRNRPGGGGGSAEAARAALRRLRSDVLDVEEAVPWGAVRKTWRGRRPAWRRALRASDSAACVARAVREFRGALAPGAPDPAPDGGGAWEPRLEAVARGTAPGASLHGLWAALRGSLLSWLGGEAAITPRSRPGRPSWLATDAGVAAAAAEGGVGGGVEGGLTLMPVNPGPALAIRPGRSAAATGAARPGGAGAGPLPLGRATPKQTAAAMARAARFVLSDPSPAPPPLPPALPPSSSLPPYQAGWAALPEFGGAGGRQAMAFGNGGASAASSGGWAPPGRASPTAAGAPPPFPPLGLGSGLAYPIPVPAGPGQPPAWAYGGGVSAAAAALYDGSGVAPVGGGGAVSTLPPASGAAPPPPRPASVGPRPLGTGSAPGSFLDLDADFEAIMADLQDGVGPG